MSDKIRWRDAKALRDENERLREAAETAGAWLERWAVHVGDCPGGGLCSCGLEVARHELTNALFDTTEAQSDDA